MPTATDDRTTRDDRTSTSATQKVAVRRRAGKIQRAVCEYVEPRTLLAAAIRAQVPASISPTSAAQTLMGPGVNAFNFNSTSTTTASVAKYRFSLNNAASDQLTTFTTTRGGASTTDAAIALYDASGNQIKLQDADTGGAGAETFSANLQSGVAYTIEFFGLQTAFSTSSYTVTVDAGKQALADAITMSPSTASGTLTTNAAPNAFTSSSDVRYFPVGFPNAGSTASVQITGAAPDTAVAVALFADNGNNTYTRLGATTYTAGGAAASLTATPVSGVGVNVTDAKYVLAVAPLNYSAAPEPVTVNVSAPSLVAPSAVSPAAASTTISQTIDSSGALVGSASGSFAAGATSLVAITAATSGPMTITYLPTTYYVPLLSVYGPGGTSILSVRSGSAPQTSVTATIDATAGQIYYLRAAMASGSAAGTFNLSVSQPYTVTAINAGPTTGVQAALPIASSSRVFRITPDDASRFLAIQLSPDSGATLQPKITILSANGTTQSFTASAAGQPVLAVIDQYSVGGPYDVQVSGIGGSGTATMKYVTLALPSTVNTSLFPQIAFSNTAGSAQTAALPLTNGAPVGMIWYQPNNANPTATTLYSSAPVSGGAASVLLHYVQDGTTYKLVDTALPGTNGTASVSSPARGQTMHAIVALPINFGSSATAQLFAVGPKPVGVNVQMTPNTVPGQPAPAEGFQSKLNISGKLANNLSRDLYSTQVPFTATGTSAITFTPSESGGPLAVQLTVLSSANNILASATSSPGQPVTVPIATTLAGTTLRFEVKAVPNSNIGGGGYSLSMAVAAPDPSPFLVTEPQFFPYIASQVAGRSYLPNNVPMPTINFGAAPLEQFFSSSVPYNNNGTGSIKVFKVTGFPSNVPFQVTTTAIDPSVNTNFALYTFDSATNSYKLVPGTGPSFDYYPGGDRSTVDARIVVNNTDLVPSYYSGEIGGGPATFYVVMKNEYGSQGKFSISAGPVPVTTAGPGSTAGINLIPVAPRSSGQFLANQSAIETVNGTSFAIRTPATMAVGGGNSTLTVKTRNGSSGQTISVTLGDDIRFLGTFTGVVQSNGTATISLPLARSSNYFVTVGASSFPSNGLALSLAVPYASATSPSPAQTTTVTPRSSGYNSSIGRLQPAPNGAISEAADLSTGVFRRVFNVESAGRVTLRVAFPGGATNANVGIYQAGRSYAGSTPAIPYSDIGVLLDSSNTVDAQGYYTISLNLAPGTYMLYGAANTGAIKPRATIIGNIPALVGRMLEVEPSTGITSLAEEVILNQGQFSTTPGSEGNNDSFANVAFRYRTALYAMTVPDNATGGPISFTAYDTFDGSGVPPTGTFTGTVSLAIFKLVNGVYTLVSSQTDGIQPGTHSFTLSANEAAVPGAQYFFSVNLNGYATPLYVGVNVPVVTSGNADLSVGGITLTPSYGQTIVQGSLTNTSFNASQATTYTLQLGGSTSTRSIPALAPFGSLPIYALWTPGAASDVVSVVANPASAIPELTRNNNTRSIALASVDPTAPSLTLSLVDANMTAEGSAGPGTGGGTWGRYISGVTGQTSTIRVNANDPDNNLFSVQAVLPKPGTGFSINGVQTFITPTGSTTLNVPVDFGSIAPTTASNPNQIRFYAVDQYGLRTPTYIQTLDVAAPPSFLTGGRPADGVAGAGGTIVFNRSTRTFTYDFQNSIISLNKNLNSLLGLTVPVIGEKKNSFLISISGTGTGGLNPNVDVNMTLTGRAALTAMDKEIFDKSYTADQQYGNTTFRSQLNLNGKSLVPGSASVSLQLSNLELLDIKSPKIPIASIGIPGIAEAKASVKFGLNAKLNAGVKMGLDPLAGSVGGYLGSLGMMSPTFIQPQITGTATVSGDISVLGFDIAELSGTVGLTLTVTLGVDNNVPGKIIPFHDAFTGLGVAVDAAVSVHLGASVAILGEIYSYDYSKTFDLVNTFDEGTFLTDPPAFGPGKFYPAGSNLVGRGKGKGGSDVDPSPVIKDGNSPVGAYSIDASPQIVINNSVVGGNAMSVQLINAGTSSAPIANLAYSRRVGGVWSALTTIPQPNDVSDAQLALALATDGTLNGAVVVYAADNAAGSPATQTINQRLNSQDIRYRYFTGSAWGAEQSLTNDSLYDSQHSVAFNTAGSAGVVAYVHNTNSTPMGSGGLDSTANEIYASVWNSATHTFGTPVAITAGAGSDSSPSTYVDASGNRYIVWIRNNGGTSQLMYSTSAGGGAWSAPAVLQVSGLQPGGLFKDVAIGSDAAGRVETIFSYELEDADGNLNTTLYHRPALTNGFGTSLPAVQIAANANFSGLRTANTPSGALVVVWQQSDGQTNQIFQSTIVQGSASTPVQVTSSQDIAKSPAVAVDGDGKLQVLYENEAVYGGTAHGSPTDPSVGTPVAAGVASSSAQMLPQFSFASPLEFPVEQRTAAPIGSQITGSAVITNRGLAAASVTITAYNGAVGVGSVAGTKTITLQPGATYDYSQAFTVQPGTTTYSVKLTTSSAQAFNNTTENLSTATLSGLADVSAVSLTNDVAFPSPGTGQLLYGTVKNEGATPVGPFTVTLYSGDPRTPQTPATAVATQTVNSLAGLASTTLLWNVILAAGAGDNIFTMVVNPAGALAEVTANNNYARYQVNFRADPAFVTSVSGIAAVRATLLNSGTSNNVRVDATVSNLGATDLVNMPVNLRVSRNGGPLVDLGQTTIASLPAGATADISFTITALAGDNVFTAAIDPSVAPKDSDLSNNAGTATLQIAGQASLTATASLSSNVNVAGTPLSLTANLINAGLADVDAVPLVVIATPQGGGASTVVGRGTIDVAGLGTKSASIALNTAGLVRGIYDFTLQVDPDGQIVQDNSLNTSASVTGIIATPLVLNAASQYVRLDTNGTQLEIWNSTTMSGSPTQSLLLSTVSSLSTAPGQVTNLAVDFTNGSPIPTGGFAFSATGANSNLTVVGASQADTFNLMAGAVGYVRGTVTGSITYSNLGSITISGGSGAEDVINLSASGGNPLPANLHLGGSFTLNGFSSFAGTTVDLGNSTVYLAYSPGNDPVSAIRQYLVRGYNNGAWNGVATASAGSINSSAAFANAGYTIGYADSADGTGTNTRANTIKLKYTRKGDANIDGQVNFNDLVTLAQNYNTSGKVWDRGDFDYDGSVQFSDLVILAQGYGTAAAALVNLLPPTLRPSLTGPGIGGKPTKGGTRDDGSLLG